MAYYPKNQNGQSTMANSEPIVIASDQTAIPVTGTFTANIGSTNGLALNTTLTSGDLLASLLSGDKGSTVAGLVTSTDQGTSRQGLDVQIRTSTGVAIDSFGGSQQYADGVARGTALGTLIMGDDGTNIQSLKVDSNGLLAIQDGGGSITIDGTITANLGTIADIATQTTLSVLNTKIPSGLTITSTRLLVDGSGVTQPISGFISISGTPTVTVGNASLAVTGSFFQATQPISVASLPLPTNAATSALQTTGNTNLSNIDTKTPALGQALMVASTPVVIASNQSALAVTGTFFQGTQPVSVASMPTTPVTGTFWQTTQPISGTVTSNIGTTNGLALDATLTGGTAKSINRGGAKGTTTTADITSTNQSTDRQALDVQIRTSTGIAIDSFGGGTQYAQGTTNATPTGTAAMGKNPSNVLNALTLDASGNLNVNVAAGGTSGVQFVDGAVRGTATGTLSMGDDGTNIQSIKVDSLGVLAIQDNGGSITVDASSLPLPTGAATETTLAAINTKLIEGQDTMANSIPVVIASNQSAIPISGTITSNAGTNLNTSALNLETTQIAIKTAVEIIDNAIIGNQMQVNIVAPLPTGTNSIGQVTANIGNTIFIQSAGNSSTAQLAASATFTGAVENLLAGKAFVISLRVDQPVTINILQYIDAAGTQLIGTTTFTRLANAPFNEAILINGNYGKVTVQNTGVSATTNLVLDTWFGDMPPFPVSVTNSGNFKTAIQELPTLIKGTQGTTGVYTQNLKDAGRNARNFMLDAYTAAPLIEAVQSVVQWFGNAAVVGTTQPAVVTTGKTLRLTHYTITTKSLATVGSAVVRIRANTAGLGVLASPLVFSMEAGSRSGATTIAMTGGTDTYSGVFPEGLEFSAGTGLAFSMAGYGPTGLLALQGVTRFQVFGYEY